MSAAAPELHRVGVVAIGRNEGERLRRCLEALEGKGFTLVYVDSGSTDGSVQLARSKGAEVVELDLATPFTAARARNEGFARLLQVAPATELVQFVDGDCEVDGAWIPRGVTELDARADLAVVCGRRRERHPEATIYNRLCDLEWDTPIGDTDSCGGDALVRVEAFRAVGGFHPLLIAGEEPELCLRLREAGWKISRIDAEMTVHDAAMTRFGQWWNRARRTGHTAAEVVALHGKQREADKLRRVRSSVFWAAGLPALTLLLLLTGLWLGRIELVLGALALPAAGYGLLILRVYRSRRQHGDPPGDCWLYAGFCALGKWPELAGLLLFHRTRAAGRDSQWIEYKDAPAGPPGDSTRG